jgi:hypothetical protein
LDFVNLELLEEPSTIDGSEIINKLTKSWQRKF